MYTHALTNFYSVPTRKIIELFNFRVMRTQPYRYFERKFLFYFFFLSGFASVVANVSAYSEKKYDNENGRVQNRFPRIAWL